MRKTDAYLKKNLFLGYFPFTTPCLGHFPQAVPNPALYPSRVKFTASQSSSATGHAAGTTPEITTNPVTHEDVETKKVDLAVDRGVSEGGGGGGAGVSVYREPATMTSAAIDWTIPPSNFGIADFVNPPPRVPLTDYSTEEVEDDDVSSLCSSMASSTTGPKDRLGAAKFFLAKLEEEEFEIRSRKSKFALKCVEDSRVAFVAADVDSEAEKERER